MMFRGLITRSLCRKLSCSLDSFGAQGHQIRRCSTQVDKWQLFSAVCLQRHPIVSKEKSPLEKDFSDLMSQVELENSSLSDHELRHKEDLILAEKRKQEDFEETEAEAARQTALEDEDKWEEELKAFNFGSRVTEADRSNDEKSLERLLDRQLVLVVKQKLGAEETWVFPMGPHKAGESMRHCAERTLEEICGEDLKSNFIGNAPVGFMKYKFPTDVQKSQGCVGAKVFFFKAWHNSGNVNQSSQSLSDFKWLTKEQIPSLIQPMHFKCINKFLVEL